MGESLRPRLSRVQILGRNLAFLRQTRMPSVVVDLAAPGEDSLFAEDPYLLGLGEAVALGIGQYFAVK